MQNLSQFNYDINDYSTKDLEDMMGLTVPYNRDQIISRSKQLLQLLKNKRGINPENYPKLEEFLAAMFNRLKKEDFPEELRVPNIVEDINNEHFIIRPEPVSVVHTRPEQLAPGRINPISQRTIPKLITIDSRFRKEYYKTNSADLNLTLPFKINKVLVMNLESVQIPATYYPINAAHDNNNFIIVVTDGAGGNWMTFQVIIPDGFYSNSEFITYLNTVVFTTDWDTRVAAVSAPFARVASPTGVFQNQLIAKYHSTTGKIIFCVNPDTVSSITELQLDFARPVGSTFDGTTWTDKESNTELQLRMGWMLGYQVALYIGNTSYVGESPMNIVGPKYLYIAVDDYQNNNHDNLITAFAESYLSKNMLARVPLTGAFGLPVPFTDIKLPPEVLASQRRIYFGPVDIERLRVQILDDLGRQINLNGADWNFTLHFSRIYES